MVLVKGSTGLRSLGEMSFYVAEFRFRKDECRVSTNIRMTGNDW